MSLQSTDPEYTQRLGAFLEEVRNEPGSMLEPTTRWLAILATLTGNGSVDAYKEALPQALQEGLDPVAVKEMVYQATDYLGYGRALPFLHATNEVLTAAGISNGQDVYNTIIAGADATGSSSGVAKAADRAAMVDEMIAAVRKAWDERHTK